MKTENIIKFLIEEKNYDRVQTERLASKIDGLSEDIKQALFKWIETDEITSPEYSGYTVEKIMVQKPDMTVLGAYLALDWIRTEPEIAIKAISTPIIRFIPKGKKQD